MNLINISPVVAVTAVGLFALPAQAFSLAGSSSHTADGLPTELTVTNEVYVPDEDGLFTVLGLSELDIKPLALEGSLGEFGVTDGGTYGAVSGYVTGFQFLGQGAAFNLSAGENVLFSGIGGSELILDSALSGDIVDLGGTLLATVTGSLSSSKVGDQLGRFSLELEATPVNVGTPDPVTVPEPGLLVGLMGVLGAIARKAIIRNSPESMDIWAIVE